MLSHCWDIRPKHMGALPGYDGECPSPRRAKAERRTRWELTPIRALHRNNDAMNASRRDSWRIPVQHPAQSHKIFFVDRRGPQGITTNRKRISSATPSSFGWSLQASKSNSHPIATSFKSHEETLSILTPSGLKTSQTKEIYSAKLSWICDLAPIRIPWAKIIVSVI